MQKSGILTGQYVRIEQPLASVGDRIVAQLVDWTADVAYALFMIWLLQAFDVSDGLAIFYLIALPILLAPLLFEVFNHGQTLGKMVMKMRVVMRDGNSPDLEAYALRWAFILVDGISFFFLGSLFIMFTRCHQRLGDLAAGTVVIKLQGYDRRKLSLDDYSFLSDRYKPSYPEAAALSLEQVGLISKALESDNEQRIDALAAKVEQTLGISRKESYTDLFLRTVVHDYQYFAMRIEL